MGDAALNLTHAEGGAEFENFDVVGFDDRRERSEIDLASAGRAVVFAGELDIVDMEAGEAVAQRFEMQLMIDEAEVFFDLGVPSVMPISQGGAIDFFEKEAEVTIERKFFE